MNRNRDLLGRVRLGSNCGKIRPGIDQLLSEVGQHRPNSDRNRPQLARNRPELARVPPEIDRLAQSPARTRNQIGLASPTLAPKWAKLGPLASKWAGPETEELGPQSRIGATAAEPDFVVPSASRCRIPPRRARSWGDIGALTEVGSGPPALPAAGGGGRVLWTAKSV